MTITEIFAETRSLCDADSTSYPDAVLLRRVNAKYEQIVGDLIAMNGKWQFDDTNYSTFPIGKGTLVEGQQDYAFDESQLVIRAVKVLDKNGRLQDLTPIDSTELPREEIEKTTGLPLYYDKSGSSLLLTPAPTASECTLANGLRVYFQRTASVFTTAEVTAGTKKPGFASPYHMILAYAAAIPYCMSYKKDRVSLYRDEMMMLETKLLTFESNKEKDERKPMTFTGVCHT